MLPQMIMTMLKSLGKSVFKRVLSPKQLFQNLVKKGNQFGKNANDFTKAIQNDSKKFLKDKLNFKSKISDFFQEKVSQLTDKTLGINSKATFERHKYINKLKKTGASIAEILEFEKEYGLDPDRAKAEYNKLVVPKTERDPLKEPDIPEEELPTLPEEAGVLGEYISRAWSSLSKTNNLHSKETIKTLVELDENMSSDNKQLLDGLIDSLDESNLMAANNSEEIQRQVAMASQLSTKIQEQIADMTEEQSQAIADGFKNIEESIRLYSETQGQRIEMLGTLATMAKEEPEEDNSHSFAELMKGNSLIVDLVSQSQKSPAEILQSFDQAMNDFVQDIGKEIGFYGGLVWGMLDMVAKKPWGNPIVKALTGPLRDMLGTLLGISPDDKPEEEQEEQKIKMNTMAAGTFTRSDAAVSDNARGILESQVSYGSDLKEEKIESWQDVQKRQEQSIQRAAERQQKGPDVVIVKNENNNTVRGDYRTESKIPPQPNGDRRP